MTRDEVVQAMEELSEYADNELHPVVSPDNWHIYACIRDLIDEALALLKEEPRPLSLEDVLQIYHTLDNHVWPYNTPPYLWCEINRKMYDAFSDWVTWREVKNTIEREVTLRPLSIDNYGELWTLYLRRPDKEDSK